jgi:hypothetical protein
VFIVLLPPLFLLRKKRYGGNKDSVIRIADRRAVLSGLPHPNTSRMRRFWRCEIV